MGIEMYTKLGGKNMAKEYVQTVKPVSRIAEKIFGWLGWIILLAITVGILFFSLVTMNDQATINQLTVNLEEQLANVDLQGMDPQTVIDMTIDSLGNVWAVALYLAFPLIIALLGLLNMKRRILSGILLLIAAVMAAPLFVTLVTSLFFVIAAILLFARKDKVVRHAQAEETYGQTREEPVYRERETKTTVQDQDIKEYEKENDNYGYVNDNEADDIESTRKFDRIDEEDYKREDKLTKVDPEYDYNNSSDLKDFDDVDREDPTQTRRKNVDRRNRE